MWWYIILGVVLLFIAYSGFAFAVVERFVRRCESLMSTSRFMAPCEIAVAHATTYGIQFGHIEMDTQMISKTFTTLEESGDVVGREHDPDELCQCVRTYCLKFGGKRRRTILRKPKFEWLPDFKPKSA